ncbi:YhfX family PLP-dependent enzyme [Testudinibacter aquarius]|uniref:Putative amino acid racemase n=1 Tax=Testudinibacter aquarius TaxID=1524974 RepID=A0A4R3XVA2_9PAST|nr:YhfX family PLP-dependent enzyme [Testudinibacter aquarius]KAE9528291.1 hypothetical protein A1D24_10305 [Testudinibacter aquarius]TCV83655.1 putative amino acid racemase [Testudinibacter aquarius]TNG91577.1 YhfX family PLP-dependent enzyme [Testudinibacter aquarius]
MFLSALQKQNPRLIDSAIALWQAGKILPDTYVIDVDQVLENGKKLVACAKQHSLSLYIMGKQFGRNPYLCRELLKLGFDGIVAVDYKEARQYYRHHLPVAHVGHLVQCPTMMLQQIIKNKPQVMTVYSLEKAAQISQVAQKLNITQPIMLKICTPQDIFYQGQESGFLLTELPDTLKKINALANIRVVGVTHFPCLLADLSTNSPDGITTTPNFNSLLQAANILQNNQCELTQINAPSLTCCASIPLLKNGGATHAEPGHALAGTIPINQNGEQPEKVAMLYLSEISHHFDQHSYCFGGGYYPRGHLENALVGQTLQPSKMLPFEVGNIDYHLVLDGIFPIGAPVVMCFRTQIFVTRSDVALISHDSNGNPELIGIFDSQGNARESALC